MPCARRTFLRAVGGGLALAAAGLTLPRRALAGDMSLRERIDLLYSNKFTFNHRGQPQISVALMEGQREVFLDAPQGLRVLPSGESGTAIEGGTRWRIELAGGRASEQRYRVALESLPANDLRAIEAASRRWRAAGFEPSERELGALFGVGGRVLDTRTVLLTSGRYGSESEAQQQSKLLIQRHGALGRLHPEVERRAEGRMVAHDLDHGVEIRAEGVLWFEPRAGATMNVRRVLHGTTIGKPSREDRSYRGQIYVAIDRRGQLCVVNSINESEVLRGLVPAEIFASGPAAALEAQAVAARGQLLAKIGTRHLDDPFLLCAQEHCQVYAGVVREDPRTDRAVERTIGRVLMRPSGSLLVDTVYSANSGGFSEDNDLVWPSPADPQLRGTADPLLPSSFAGGIDAGNLRSFLTSSPSSYSRPASENLQDAYRWRREIDPASLAGNPGIPDGFGKLEKLEVLERGRSGRALRARLTSDKASIEIHGELDLRRALGALKSSLFIVDPERDAYGRFVLHGGGHGHGVGMCQHGAIGMATAGKSYAKILAHYYQGSQLATLW